MPSLQIIILILIFVGPFILRIIAKYAEWQKNSTQRKRDEMEGQMRFDESDDPQARAQVSDPANMTMAQRIELARQRAQQQADPRAAQIEVQRRAQLEAQRRAQAEALERQQQQVDAQRRQQAAAREQARRRQAEEQARRQGQSPQRQQPQSTRPAQRPAQGQVPTARPVNRKQERVGAQRKRVQSTIVAGEKTAMGRPVTAPMKRLSKNKGGGNISAVFDGVSLKRAYILKELLDRPIALREGSSEYPL